jgi:hypothetical protein
MSRKVTKGELFKTYSRTKNTEMGIAFNTKMTFTIYILSVSFVLNALIPIYVFFVRGHVLNSSPFVTFYSS